MVDQALEAVIIGVGSSLLGALVGAFVGYYFSEKAANRRDHQHLIDSQYRAAITVGPELMLIRRWISETPNSTKEIADPDKQLPDVDYPSTTGFNQLILSVYDLPPGVREMVMEKLSAINRLLFAYRTAVIWVRKRSISNLKGSDGRIEWNSEDASNAEFKSLFERFLDARIEFLTDLDEIDQSLGQITERRFV